MARFKKTKNVLLYLIAFLFLGYHLLPIAQAASTKVSEQLSEKKQISKIVDDAQCVAGEGSYDQLTFGNPIQDPLYVTVPYTDPAKKPVTGANLIWNYAFQAHDEAGAPDTWSNDANGDIQAKFAVKPDGPSGQNAAHVSVSAHKSGDAKWSSLPIDVKPGEYFRYEVQYKTTANTYAVVDYTLNDGTHHFIVLPPVPSTNNQWQTYRSSFVAPAFVETMQIAQVIDEPGELATTQYKLVRQKLPQFNRGLVSINFDDGWKSIYENGMPLFDKYDIKTTQYIISDVIGDPAYMTPEMLKEFEAKGHEIGSHTMNHEELAKASDQTVIKTLAGSRDSLNLYYKHRVVNFAPPYGSYNAAVKKHVRECYESMRSTETGYNAADYDRYSLRVLNIESNTKPEEIATAVRFARDHKLWLVLVYHEVDNSSASSYAASLNDLDKQLKIIKDEHVPVVTIAEGLAETLPQLVK